MSRLLLAAALLGACSGETPPCDPPTSFGCAANQQCETVTGASPRCLPPVVVSGRVLDSSTLRPVVNARVVLLDTTGVPLTGAATSRSDGVWVARLPSPRNADETPVGQTVTPRIEASGYFSYPEGFRLAAEIQTSGATLVADGSERLVAARDVRLFAGSGFGTGQIFGQVDLPAAREQIMVVVQPIAFSGPSTAGIVDVTGAYRVFGLPPGAYSVRALGKGYEWVSGQVSVSSMGQIGANLRLLGPMSSRINGDVAAPDGSSGTIVVTLGAPTTRDPVAGFATTVAYPGPFAIDGVPPGEWSLLVARPVDGVNLAFPADVTVIAHTDASVSVVVQRAVRILGPGAMGLEQVSVAPVIGWRDVSGETGYSIAVTDALGTQVWSRSEPAHAGDDPSIPYQGPLVPGQLYHVTVSAGGVLMSSEELAGWFTLPAR